MPRDCSCGLLLGSVLLLQDWLEHWKNPNRHSIHYVTREGEPPGCLRANCCYKFNYSRVAVARKLLCRGLIETEEADAVDADTAVRALIAKSQALSTLP